MSGTKQVAWDLAGKLLSQGVGFFISIVLTRLLTPEDFGLVGMVMAFIFISKIFLDLGFTAGIIQKKEISEKELSSIFFLNLAIGILLTIIMASSANLVSDFYGRSELYELTLVLSVNFILYASVIVQRSLFSREVNFKVQTKISLLSAIISGVIGVSLAFLGYGVWALVFQNFSFAVIEAIYYWVASKWRPMFYFKFSEIKEVWSFSVHIFLANLLNNLVARIDYLLVGKIFNATDLGYYTRAQSFNQLIVNYSAQSIGKVAFPIISRDQDDLSKVNKLLNKSLNLTSFIGVGLSAVLFIVSKDLFVILFGQQWIVSAEMFQIISLYVYAGVVSFVLSQFIMGMGYSKFSLKLEVVKKSIFILGYVIGLFYGIYGFIISIVISRSIALFINFYGIHHIGLESYNKIFKTVFKYVIIGVISALIVFFIPEISDKSLIRIVFNFSLTSLIYLLLNYTFKMNGLLYILDKLKLKRL
jgi:O-antigen/teichoic acid export membrane protein